ncbi:winged helix-turn-helix transcriptional regulator [Georgenia sp. 311]|uniref:Winged helix-turn-helix transcriptional regulator n=1 Tax=Georgenia wutianyii TaxID=2585135 RepID=A0ABX5VKR6_9MICO|nr:MULTISPECIES: winged helix-turn-helix transcriptional regulator [Georgenia]QDB79047.1 winged helix-turn-helix transcriptional regulator [Georgenia wutianyii]TNC17297.1 winged helix-turn-helix transcriptional regulator [Georgenia sp. 311]
MSETNVESDVTTQDRVLRLVVEQGPISAAELARLLELTPAGVRRHIAALEREERIVVHLPTGPEQRRRGRPARYYVATDAGRAGLSHAYSDLATQALGFIETVAGPDAVERFAGQRVGELEERYAPVVAAAGDDVADRAHALAGALTADGYAATVRSVGPHGLAVQLCQGNCPVLTVAESYHQLCDAETRAFSRLLGVHVQRLATLARGEHVCTTHIPTVQIGRPSTTTSPRGDAMEGN